MCHNVESNFLLYRNLSCSNLHLLLLEDIEIIGYPVCLVQLSIIFLTGFFDTSSRDFHKSCVSALLYKNFLKYSCNPFLKTSSPKYSSSILITQAPLL